MNKLFIALILILCFSACSKTKTEKNKEQQTVIEANNNDTLEEKKEVKGTTISLTADDFLKKVADYKNSPNKWSYLGDKPAIIDFYAEWCGPCKKIAPILAELAAEYQDSIYVYKVDVDEYGELAGLFNVNSIPALLFIPMDKNPIMEEGLQSKAQLEEKINNFLLTKEKN